MLELIMLDGSGRRFAIPEGAELRIGVEVGCSVRLRSEDVSRVHALVEARGGRTLLLDLGSKNGTFLNGRRIKEAEVTAGDLVRFSSISGQIVQAGEAAADDQVGDVTSQVPAESAPTPTDEWVQTDLPGALNRLLGAWRRDERAAVASLIRWLVESRGMRGAAVLETVGAEITVGAAHGELGKILEDPHCLALVRGRGDQGPVLETVHLTMGDEGVLGIAGGSLPWLLLLPRTAMPDTSEVELWVHLLALACRLDHCVTGKPSSGGTATRD